MNRRDAIKSATALAFGSMVSASVWSQGGKQRVLILGGTGFIGPHFVEVLRSQGHTITLFNRGRRNPGLFKDVETLIGDRDGKLDSLQGRDWDVVIDDSGFVPRIVQQSADLLHDRVQHYIYVSSISAYADLSKANLDEDQPLAVLKDPTVEQMSDGAYGGLKALCEQVVRKAYGRRSAVIRPSYIVGPGDTSDRFTYWPVRVSRGGEMLAPGTASDPIQFIDVRDLADFMRLCVERRIGGTYNLCNLPRSVSMGSLLETSKKISQADAHFVWADTAFLEQQHLIDSGELPIWSPPTGETAGAALISPARAVAQGLRFRSLETTITDTLAWHRQRPTAPNGNGGQTLRARLSPERETELLALLKSRRG